MGLILRWVGGLRGGIKVEKELLAKYMVAYDAYKWNQTVRAGENHPTSRYRSHLRFIRAVGVIKGKCEGE